MSPPQTNPCLISLGANLGDPVASITAAAEQLRVKFGCGSSEFQLSPLFRTPPVGGPSGQPPFINAVVALHTKLDPWESWSVVRNIEEQLGRVRQRRWEARMIDVDILLHGQHRIWTPQLKIPHPRMCMRRFILLPASQVAADWRDPVSGCTIEQLANSVRTGPSNLTVYAMPASHAATILEEAARLSVARWANEHEGNLGCKSRWVRLVELDDLHSAELQCNATKLSVLLAEPCQVDGAQWEDVQSPLATHFGFTADATSRTLAGGARYLLSSDDPAWAVHELAAAMDAMDCPVERAD